MPRRLIIIVSVFFCVLAVPFTKADAGTDKKPPVVNISSSLMPVNGGLINNAKPLIAAEFMDEGIGVSTGDTRMFIDGLDVSGSAQVTANKITYTPSTPLGDGAHMVRINVVDKAGNASEVQWSFRLHTEPPRIKITSHKPNQFINKSPVVITGTVSDPRARVLVNGVSAFVEKKTFSAKVNLVEGNNTITATATDAFGNSGTDGMTIIVDTKPPVVSITAPAGNSLVNSRLVTVTGLTDKNAAFVTLTLAAAKESIPAALHDGAFVAKDVQLKEGLNTITVKAVSRAGNVGTALARITVDSIPPKLLITAPKNLTVTNKKMLTVSGTVDKRSAMVKVNNTPVQVSKGVFSLSSLSLSEGTNIIKATAVDRAGNHAVSAPVTVVLDTTPPAPPTLSPLPPVTRTAFVTVSGTTESSARVDVFSNSTPQGTVRADEKGAFTLKVKLIEGNNALSAVAYDSPGNVSSPSTVMNVFLDTKPPKIL